MDLPQMHKEKTLVAQKPHRPSSTTMMNMPMKYTLIPTVMDSPAVEELTKISSCVRSQSVTFNLSPDPPPDMDSVYLDLSSSFSYVNLPDITTTYSTTTTTTAPFLRTTDDVAISSSQNQLDNLLDDIFADLKCETSNDPIDCTPWDDISSLFSLTGPDDHHNNNTTSPAVSNNDLLEDLSVEEVERLLNANLPMQDSLPDDYWILNSNSSLITNESIFLLPPSSPSLPPLPPLSSTTFVKPNNKRQRQFDEIPEINNKRFCPSVGGSSSSSNSNNNSNDLLWTCQLYEQREAERMRRNNEASRRSRAKKKVKYTNDEQMVQQLQQENFQICQDIKKLDFLLKHSQRIISNALRGNK